VLGCGEHDHNGLITIEGDGSEIDTH
jgi:hypothetical protein